MAKYRLKIHLLSDLCISDGGVYNSMVDTDCCHNNRGFPFIPAKRIKGCLRECALELNDWGKNIPVGRIFGEGERPEEGTGVKRAVIRIGDAYLQDYPSMVKEVNAHPGHMLYHPQHILNCFTSLRTQTAVSFSTGIADPHSLRTIRVINKGLTFTSEVEMPQDYYEYLKECCAVLTGMGVSRTRGFGEVLVTIDLKDNRESEKNRDEDVVNASATEGAAGNSEGKISRDPLVDSNECQVNVGLVPGAGWLSYEITLEEPVICKSVAGGEARTLDYIEGSKVLGLILDRIKKQDNGQEKALRFLDEKTLRCTNAYIGYDGKRYTEVPAYLYSIKNDKDDYVDRREHRQNPEGIQLSQMKHCYVRMVNETLYTLDVDVEERYHHRRAEDKSIGRAVSTEGNSDFYQMASIMAGQKFYGRLYGTEEQVKTAYDCLAEEQSGHIGYSRSAEYGKVRIRVIESGKPETSQLPLQLSGSRIDIKLESPTIIYNDKAMYSVDQEDLLKEILAALQIDRKDVADDNFEAYLNFTSVGGFNVTWGRRKPTVAAFDKGTALRLNLCRGATVPTTLFLGERSMEGYGEASVVCRTKEQKADGITEHDIKEWIGSKKMENEGPSMSGNPVTCPDPHSTEYSDYLENAIKSVRSGSVVSVVTGHPINNEGQECVGETSDKDALQITIAPDSLGEQLADKLFKAYLGAYAREQVRQQFQKPRKGTETSLQRKTLAETDRCEKDQLKKYKPTISNILVGFEEYRTMAEVEKMVTARYGKRSDKKEEKLRYAENIIEQAKGGFAGAQEQFFTVHGIVQWDWNRVEKTSGDSTEDSTGIVNKRDQYQLAYLHELLLAMKLMIRSFKD